MARSVSPFPWAMLDALSRGAVRGAAAARRRIERAVPLQVMAAALTRSFAVDTALVVRDVALSAAPPAGPCMIALEVADGSARLRLRVEPQLAALLLARALDRPAPLVTPEGTLAPAAHGALTALLIDAGRHSGGRVALRVDRSEPPHRPALVVSTTVLIEDRPYDVAAHVWWRNDDDAREPVTLEALARSSFEIAVPLVVAESLASRDQVASLRPGDAWMPGDGWWLDLRRGGDAALAAPDAARGSGVTLDGGGKMAVSVASRALTLYAEEAMSDSKVAAGDAEAGDDATQPGSVALDAPVVVRVEIGEVSLKAREWAALRPGDVIETGRRIAEPVVLRIAGRAVARGELCDIEGELGVRIRELVHDA